MKSKLNKVLTLGITGAMLLGSLSGCTQNGNTKVAATPSTAETTKGEVQGTSNIKKFDKEVEIQIPVYDRGVQGAAPVDNNYWTKYIQENFGNEHNIKVSYVAIPRTDEVNKFNMLLAAKDAPDIIFHYDYPSAMAYYDLGALQEINTDMLKQYAPTYYKNMEDKGILQYGVVDGKQMFVAGSRPDAYNFVTVIREDWLEKAGLAMPKNLTEYENALLKFKELKLGGEETIPYAVFLPTAYVVNYPYRDYPLDEKELALYSDLSVASLTWGPTKAFIKTHNKFYNEGLLTPEFALDADGAQAQADFMSGKAGVCSYYLSQNPPVLQTLLENCPDAKVAVLDSGALVPEGGVPSEREYWPFGMIMGFNQASSEDEVIATMMLLEWMSNPEVLFTLQNGIEGVTYNLVEGLPVLVSDYAGEERLNYNSNKDMWCLVTEGKEYGSEEKNLQVAKTTYAPPGFEHLIQQRFDQMKANREYWYTDYLFSTNIASVAENKATLMEKWQEYYTSLTMCKPEEFEALYAKYSAEYLAAGYQAILDERAAAYDASH